MESGAVGAQCVPQSLPTVPATFETGERPASLVNSTRNCARALSSTRLHDQPPIAAKLKIHAGLSFKPIPACREPDSETALLDSKLKKSSLQRYLSIYFWGLIGDLQRLSASDPWVGHKRTSRTSCCAVSIGAASPSDPDILLVDGSVQPYIT